MPLRLCKSTMYSISDDGKTSNDLSSNNSKSMTRFNCKSNHVKIIKREQRLSGGADDVDETNVEENSIENKRIEVESNVEPVVESSTIENSKKVRVEPSKQFRVQESDLNDNQSDLTNGPCCVCVTHLINDNKIKEIIDYAHQNLQDAGKALATLGENFEHGLKLAIVDVLGRIQQWSTTVQNKLDVCKGDIERLQAELLSQMCAITDKENKIRELNKQIANLTDEIDRLKQELAECKMAAKDHMATMEKLLTKKQVAPEKTVKKANPVEESNPVKEITEDAPIAKNPKTEDSPPIEKNSKTEDPPPIAKKSKTEDSPIVVKKSKTEDTPMVKQSKTEGSPVERPIERIGKVEEARRTKVQTREKDKEKKRREIELECEIGCLRKENERLMKEKIDYENAIQRALLRGVSSLNVEALRVLRCPPIPCCSPCAPCPMSFIPTTCEDTVPCPVKVKRPCPGRTANKEYCNRYGNGNGNGNENENINGNGNGSGKNWRYNHCDPMIKQLCASPCCPAGKNRQNSDNSMYFLLHQGDAENVCRTNERLSPRPCGSPIMKKIEIPSPCSRFTRL